MAHIKYLYFDRICRELGDCAEVDGRVRLYVMPIMQGARALTHTGEDTAVNYPIMPVVVKTPAPL